MKAILLGAGKQGKAIAYALVKLGYNDLIIVDWLDDNLIEIKTFLSNKFSNINIKIIKDGITGLNEKDYENVEFVISGLPYISNFEYAEIFLNKKIPWYDLGGNVTCSEEIESLAITKKCKVFTDIGLAPGFIGCLALHLIKKIPPQEKINSVNMYCGGLPIRKDVNKLGYIQTFSLDGLINEYFDTPIALVNGQITEIEPFGDLENNPDLGFPYEAFNTSGGITRKFLNILTKNNILNACYKTIRYRGHHDIISFMKDDLELSDFDLRWCINKSCKKSKQSGDFTVCVVIIKTDKEKYGIRVSCRWNKEFTAMQMSTGFIAAIIAHLTKNINKIILSEEDVDYENLMGIYEPMVEELCQDNQNNEDKS